MTDEEIRQRILAAKKQKLARRRIISACAALALAIIGGSLIGFLGGRLFGGRFDPDKIRPVSVTADVPIVNAAKTGIGNKGGEPFWSWYGFGSRVEWCACFASWCEDQCGYIDSDDAPKFALVSDGVSWFRNRDQWLEAGEKPEAGDLITFDWEQDGVIDHVGVVSAVTDDKVFTIEGNSSDRCRIKRYDLSSPVIYGYGQIKQDS